MDPLIVYTDGCHRKNGGDGFIGIGGYISRRDKEYKLSLKVTPEMLKKYGIDPKAKISNPTAEFLAFAESLSSILSTGFPGKVIFRIDYIGIEKWMMGKWRCNEDYIARIRETCVQMIRNYELEFEIQHVAGHSGDSGNDMADQLANLGSGVNTIPELDIG